MLFNNELTLEQLKSKYNVLEQEYKNLLKIIQDLNAEIERLYGLLSYYESELGDILYKTEQEVYNDWQV